nr:unnamed protein product [Digitaria exilis]
MMTGGEFKSSSLLQQMMWSGSGGTDSKNMMSSLMPCAEEHLLQISSGLAPEVNNTGASLARSSDLHDGVREGNMPQSWSQLLLGGLVGDHERYSAAALLSKGLEEQPMPQDAAAYTFYGHGGGEEIQTPGTNKSQVSQMLLASSPRSCITSSLIGSNMLDFSNNSTVQAPEVKNHHSDNSSEGNSTASGSAPKKARVQTSSSAQSTLKVSSSLRSTDTASVLQETIGYIRFLLSQIEALSFPYLGHGNGNSMQQHTVASLLNNSTGDGMGEAQGSTAQGKKDLRSRGLCLVPVSCTSHLADDNDFWAVAAAPPPPPLGGIIWR